jgi:hypothetical protein
MHRKRVFGGRGWEKQEEKTNTEIKKELNTNKETRIVPCFRNSEDRKRKER